MKHLGKKSKSSDFSSRLFREKRTCHIWRTEHISVWLGHKEVGESACLMTELEEKLTNLLSQTCLFL